MARLVIIDDESHITDIIARFFREKGHEVQGFTLATEALAHLAANPTDLVITDIAMKGLSGLDLLKKMRDAGLDIPVIVTTGNPSHNSAVQALRSGAFDYVVKPFHLDEISERADKALSTKRVKDENLLYSKLVSLHSISRVTAEAASMEELSTKVIKLGTRLTGSDGGWYWVASPSSDTAITAAKVLYPDAENIGQHGFLIKVARSTAEKMDVEVTDDPGPGGPVTVHTEASGITSRAAALGRIGPDGGTLEPLQKGADGAWYLSLPVEVSSAIHGVLIFRRLKPAPKYDAVDLEVFNQLAATFALGIRALGLFPKPASPDLSEGGKTLESWARLIGQMVDEHCAGYESKGERVEALGKILMKEMNWPTETGESWPLICRIYDIAKVRVPQRMLENRDVLGEGELEFVHAQAAWAYERISSIPGLETTARVLEDFQESFDGAGKPRGIRGRAIAPLARLLAVADAYVSMRSGRPYRGALTEAEAIEVVRQGSGKRFDPEVVLALSKARGI
ncbi:MAG: response regulator receiver modulated metal dependent phosphohydrolase [Fibrobacteres bacterium]|nr:response regulator receiver modulated metal dependent phosphohydrolase [Fibrobacterota bacterium]